MKWHKIPQSALESEQSIQLVKLDGRKFCLIRENNNWHATSVKCPHAGANLAGGWCENGKLICPYHRHQFDLIDGRGSIGQNNAITIYRLQQREDGLYIELPENLLAKLGKLFGKE